jgi:hypothetical protein
VFGFHSTFIGGDFRFLLTSCNLNNVNERMSSVRLDEMGTFPALLSFMVFLKVTSETGQVALALFQKRMNFM